MEQSKILEERNAGHTPFIRFESMTWDWYGNEMPESYEVKEQCGPEHYTDPGRC